jgi:hypothetical protein
MAFISASGGFEMAANDHELYRIEALMNLQTLLFCLTLLPVSAWAMPWAEDNMIEWLSGANEKPLLCGNDNCESPGIRLFQEGFSLTDAVIKYYPFEDFSDKLTVEMESAFDGFIFVNTAEGKPISCGEGPLKIPSQFARIIWKNKQLATQSVFLRDQNQKIIGVNDAAISVVPGLNESFFDGRNVLNAKVLSFLRSKPNDNYFPVSTGTIRNVARTMTPSGIFGIDFSYTHSYRYRTEGNQYEHMPNTILADAVYGENYQNRKFAFGIHGTPEIFIRCNKSFPNGLTINEGCPPCPLRADLDLNSVAPECIDRRGEVALGVKRDSAGCIRTYTPASKVIFNWAWKEMQNPQVPKLNPHINIPTGPLPTKLLKGMKILIIPFSGYKDSQLCRSI